MESQVLDGRRTLHLPFLRKACKVDEGPNWRQILTCSTPRTTKEDTPQNCTASHVFPGELKKIALTLECSPFPCSTIQILTAVPVLQVVDEDGIQANAAKVGGLLLERLRALQQKHDIVGDVRGQGLMLGVEMVKDRASKQPATAETAQVTHPRQNF